MGSPAVYGGEDVTTITNALLLLWAIAASAYALALHFVPKTDPYDEGILGTPEYDPRTTAEYEDGYIPERFRDDTDNDD